MDIIQRDNKYFLQLTNGELELTEQQVKRRVERGDNLKEYLDKLAKEEQPQSPPIQESAPRSAQSFITSGKYFDNLIYEFEQVYTLSNDKDEAAEKLIRFCRNAITKLYQDRKNPKTDHVVIDYYILSWSRVISFLQSLANRPAEDVPAPIINETQATTQPTTPPAPQVRDLTKPLLALQLLQADGLFPISDALQGIRQEDIIKLIGGLLGVDTNEIQPAIQNTSAILMKRGITEENREERVKLLEEMEQLFDELPYSNIISRIKLLLKIYKGQ